MNIRILVGFLMAILLAIPSAQAQEQLPDFIDEEFVFSYCSVPQLAPNAIGCAALVEKYMLQFSGDRNQRAKDLTKKFAELGFVEDTEIQQAVTSGIDKALEYITDEEIRLSALDDRDIVTGDDTLEEVLPETGALGTLDTNQELASDN